MDPLTEQRFISFRYNEQSDCLQIDTLGDHSKEHSIKLTKTFQDNSKVAVPLVGLVVSATPCEAKINGESNANSSHLRVEDKLSKRFEVHK